MQHRRRAACIILLLPLLFGLLVAVAVYRVAWPRRPSAGRDTALLSAPTLAPTASPTQATTPLPTQTTTPSPARNVATSPQSTVAVASPTPQMPTDTLTALPEVLDRVLFPIIRGNHPQVDAATSADKKASPPELEASQTPTSTPRPTPTPTLAWPPALDRPSRSKLGLHVQWNNSPEIMEFVRRMRPAVIKAIDDLGFLAEVKQVLPHGEGGPDA